MTPTDTPAELTVVGAAIYCPDASARLHTIVSPADFADPALGDLFAVTPGLTTYVPDHATRPDLPFSWEIRSVQAAHLTNIRADDVLEVVSRRLALTDATGHYARRVVAAANQRRRLVALVDELGAHGYTVVPDDRPSR